MAVNYVKFYRGTPLAFENAIKNSDTLYFIAESDSSKGELYLGEKLISGGVSSLSELEDLLIDEVKDGQLLVYNEAEGKWINKTIAEAISVMRGASSTSQGAMGLVPAPGIGQQNLFLRGDGVWAMPEGAGGSASSQVFEVVATDFSYEKQIAAINAEVGDATLVAGDIGIVKVAIAANKYQYTAYVFNGSIWTAMDGNYSSDSVYFDEDLTVTSPIGTITQEMIDEGGGSVALGSSNKSITQVLSELLAEEKDPIVDYPSVSFTTSGNTGEVGTTFTLPTATFKVIDVGSYTYGCSDGTNRYGADDTGVTFASGSVNLAQGSNRKSNTSAMRKNDTLTITATGNNIYKDESVNFVFSATATYTASAKRIPLTNLGNQKESLKIVSDSIAVQDQTATFTGYRNAFYGSNINTVSLNSTNIRGLAGKSKSSSSTLTVSIIEGAKQVIIAVPDGRKVTKVADEGAFGTDIFSEFVLTESIPVEGANGYTAKNYNVYVYSPATALGANTYTVSVTNE